MPFALSAGSRAKLQGVHPDLIAIVETAILRTPIDFRVTEGLRTRERQAALVAAGASRTMHSRHLTGHAVDLVALVDGKARWDWPLYDRLAIIMYDAARRLDLQIVWGGTWKTFKDGPHFELPRDRYPAQ